MTRQLKISPSETLDKISILHILSDKEQRLRPLENLVNELNKSMFYQVICYLRGDDEEVAELEKFGHDVITLDISKNKLRNFQPRVVLQLSKIMKEKGIDIVHCQRHKPTVYGALAAYMVGEHLKVISHVRGLNRARRFRRKLFNRILSRRISRIIAVSDAVRDDVIRNNFNAFASKVVTIYNGINIKQFADSNLSRVGARRRLGLPDKNVFVYGTVGRLVETKGQSILLQAFAKVSEENSQSWLLLAGAGRLESELRTHATELNVVERVLFLGYRTDIPLVLRACDVFVLPSIAEGLPGALLEAMASGIPVISSRVGGVPEILNNPNLGLMVSPSSVDELVTAMKVLYNMPEEQRYKTGQSLKERVMEVFSIEKMVSAIAAEYLAVMNMTPTPRIAGSETERIRKYRKRE